MYQNLCEYADNYELIAMAEKVYGPYFIQNGRQIVIVKDDKGNSRTVSWPKYILEQHLQRKLDPDKETIDHIDRNHANNSLNNLRIVPRAEHSRDDTRRVKLIKLKCNECNKDFERSPRLLRDKSKKGNRGIFCGRSCSARYARKLQLGLVDKLPIQPYIESEYTRNVKNIHSFAKYVLAKYAID